MNRLKLIPFLAFAMFVGVSCSDDDDDDMTNQIPEADRTFVVNAADGGMFEVRAGELAVAKGDSTALGHVMAGDSMSVKSFGRMMITDHTKANQELMTLASGKRVSVPTTLSTAKQQKIDSLNALSGTAFNRTYARMMVVSHQETISIFQNEASTGGDAELKSWASGKLPALTQHLQMARMMQDSIK